MKTNKIAISVAAIILIAGWMVAVSRIKERENIAAWESSLNPPATTQELARFRILKSNDGFYSNERLEDNGVWVLCPNKWKDTNKLRWDAEDWISIWRERDASNKRTWKKL